MPIFIDRGAPFRIRYRRQNRPVLRLTKSRASYVGSPAYRRVRSEHKICDLIGEPSALLVDDHAVRPFGVRPCSRHAVRNESFGTAEPISTFDRLVA